MVGAHQRLEQSLAIPLFYYIYSIPPLRYVNACAMTRGGGRTLLGVKRDFAKCRVWKASVVVEITVRLVTPQLLCFHVSHVECKGESLGISPSNEKNRDKR